jgi:hypothetical protein
VMELCDSVDGSINISKISLHLQHVGDVDLKVWNITNGTTIYGETVAVNNNKVSILPKLKIRNNGRPLLIAVGYDKTGIVSEHYSMTGDCRDCPIKSCGKHIKGFGADFNVSSWSYTRTAHTSGLEIDYSLICDYENLICQYGEWLAAPYVYKVCAEIIKYGLTTYRWNETEKPKFELMLGDFGRKYDKAMSIALDSIILPSNECFGCKNQVGARTITP